MIKKIKKIKKQHINASINWLIQIFFFFSVMALVPFMLILRIHPAAAWSALPKKAEIPRLANSFLIFPQRIASEYAYYKSNK